jgi:ribosome biogenesis GTPase / thiamine phosphate phosphatase
MVDLKDYGFENKMLIGNTKDIPARITALHKERYELICENGPIYGILKSSVYYGNNNEYFPTVGDFVLVQYNYSGDSQIVKTLDRKSKFSRNDFSGHALGYVKTVKEQVVAVNFDYVFIMASLNYDFNIRRIERYLTLSWESGGIPVVILTKSDLVDNYTEQIKAVEKIASCASVFAISSKTRNGIDLLSDYLKPGKTIVFLGSSGVGKSSLLNVLSGKTVMEVKDIREDDSRGRHTTTHRQLIMLPNGVLIIDTPGMRELGMWNVNVGLGEVFHDVEHYFDRCKFSDCSHNAEPGCGIKEAINSGELSQERWDSYLKIKRESKFVDDKAGFLHDKSRRNKSISQISRLNKKKDRYRYYYKLKGE